MKSIIRFAAANLALVLAAPIAAAGPAEGARPAEVYMTVNGDPISRAMFDLYAERRAPQLGDVTTDAARKAVTEELVVQQILVQEAIRQGIDQDPQLATQLELVRRNMLANAVIERMVAAFDPDDATLREAYAEATEDMGGTEYRARHILVETEEEAKSIIGELEGGADFSALAKEHSKDSSSDRGGDLGWFSTDSMVAPFGTAVSALEDGEYTHDPVQTRYGWHVIVQDGHRVQEAPAFDQIRPQLVERLKSQHVSEHLLDLREQAVVETP